jgi:hypothetical protein
MQLEALEHLDTAVELWNQNTSLSIAINKNELLEQ